MSAPLRPWGRLYILALQNGWRAHLTPAQNAEWCSVALRARSPGGRRVIGLWRGRDMEHMRFTSAMTWVERGALSDPVFDSGRGPFFDTLSAVELKAVLNGP